MKIRKSYICAIHDLIIIAISFLLSLYLRLGEDLDLSQPFIIIAITTLCATSFFVFSFFNIYRRVWKYTSTHDLIALTKAVTITILIFLLIMFLYNRLEGMPRSLMAINWFVMLAMLGASRFLYRMVKEKSLSIDINRPAEIHKISVLLIGANDHSELFLRETVGNKYSDYKIVGILDNDDDKLGHYVRNVKIYGNISDVEKVIAKLKKKNRAPQKIIIAPDILEGDEVKELLEKTEKLGLTMSRLPRLTDFKQTNNNKLELRPIALEDLLGRAQNALDTSAMRELISGKRVMITGAGGTIGSELVRQIASYKPEHICLYELGEHNLYLIDKELDEDFPSLSKRPVIGDIKDRKALDIILCDENIDTVFHAAALKHVPMSELNIPEAVATNVIGTKNVADACEKAKVAIMVMISTDKAVNPTNIMGATKRIAESYIQSLGSGKSYTKFVTIRFGNVLGSTGSVIPLFQRQLASGKPLTVTHPDITRYFMTVREAVELVIQSAVMASLDKGSASKIFVLDMGKPVLIRDLAEQVIRLAGLRPDIDVKIEYTGLRAGEKLHEELFHESEKPIPTTHDSIMLANPREIAFSKINKEIKKLVKNIDDKNSEKLVAIIEELLPEFDRK